MKINSGILEYLQEQSDIPSTSKNKFATDFKSNFEKRIEYGKLEATTANSD